MTSTTMTSVRSQHRITPLFWRLKDLPIATGLSLRTINRLRSQGRLPEPDAAFGRALCWRPSTISSWVDSGARARVAPGVGAFPMLSLITVATFTTRGTLEQALA